MALTRGAWTTRTIQRNGSYFIVGTCSVTATTAENDAYTKAITFLKPDKKWNMHINTAGTTLDGTSLPVDIWATPYTTKEYASMDMVGDGASVALTTDGTASGSNIGYVLNSAIIATVHNTAAVKVYDPMGTAAHAPSVTYFINLDGAGTLSAAICKYIVFQETGPFKVVV